jgi:hypothetical protein
MVDGLEVIKMKTMNCKQLGGTCDQTFSAETFDEMAELSKKHGMEMMQDEDHKKAMQEMMVLMQNPSEMQKWFEGKRKEFDETSED